jgi:hypothetical protein
MHWFPTRGYWLGGGVAGRDFRFGSGDAGNCREPERRMHGPSAIS